ncbi:MAG: CBS domain-containing protein [Kiritimatiellae bacterium]|nr:CBS domain-containing protein [Kiritimatiellia bacterium]
MKTTRAADVMTTNVITVTTDMMLTRVMDLLLRHHVSGLPVVDDDGNMVGIISEIDLVNSAFSGNAADTAVEEVMSKSVVCFPPDAELAELVQAFSQRRLRRVPIVEKGKVVGIVSRRDILREMLRRYDRY